MIKKAIVQEALDWDHRIISTFLTLFSDPRKVVTNPEKFTKPWKYATYVVSISCVFTWFFIHSFVEAQDQESFWLVPKRMLELTGGYQSFYENTQPLKRLVLGAASLYVALSIFLFYERKQGPSFGTISLYLMGHSVFIAFILQTLGVVFVGAWDSNVVVGIGAVTHILYLSYAIIRILGKLAWTTILWKGIGIFLVQYTLYNSASTRLLPNVYYGILHRGEMMFRMTPNDNIGHTEKIIPPHVDRKGSDEFRKVVVLDSLKIAAECEHPDKRQISKITLRCFSKSKQHWSEVIFEKVNRYSPDPHEVILRVDSATHTVFAFYRIANDSNASIRIISVDVDSGRQNISTILQPASDDVHVTDAVLDSLFIYLCGSTQHKLDNIDLGMVTKMDKHTGRIIATRQLGSTSFASWTSFQGMKLSNRKVELIVKRNYKWMFLFNKTSWSAWTVDRQAL